MEENNNPIQDPGVNNNNYAAQNMVPKKQNAMALTSIILALVGLIIAGLPCGIAAVITGIVGLVKFDANKENGKGLAIAGIVVGVIDVIAVIINLIITASELL